MDTTRCEDCAFTIGTKASCSPNTLVKAHLCALTGEVFHCHVNKKQLCGGWVEAHLARAAAYHKPTKQQNEIASLASELMTECEAVAVREQEAARRGDACPKS